MSEGTGKEMVSGSAGEVLVNGGDEGQGSASEWECWRGAADGIFSSTNKISHLHVFIVFNFIYLRY